MAIDNPSVILSEAQQSRRTSNYGERSEIKNEDTLAFSRNVRRVIETVPLQ
jgi:hypothetical protein